MRQTGLGIHLLVFCPALFQSNGLRQAKLGDKCLEGWTEWNEACYFINPNSQKKWTEGRADCKQQSQGQGDLVSIHSKEENDFVSDMAKPSSIWIGLTLYSKIHAEGNFAWSDGTAKDYTIWQANEPNNADTERCAEMVSPKWSEKGEWNDVKCTNKRHYICKGPKGW